jgi:dihydroorotase
MAPRSVVVRGGTVVDALGRRRADVVVQDGVVVEVAEQADVPKRAAVLDAGGAVVCPGLVDLHSHLRQPGHEEAETIETGARAAALGGYTAVVAMPNTDPAIDTAGVVREVLDLAAGAMAEVAVAGAITVARQGARLAPMAEMAALGVRMFTDDGTGVQDGALMRRALDYGRGLGVVLAQHCEDASLGGGAMHEGAWSSRLGLPGVPAAAEEVMVARDLALVRTTGAPMHFLHLSTAGSVAMVRQAKADGLPVTAEATPHHLALVDGAARRYDPVFKVNPPLRTRRDVDAVRRGVADGTVDALATDHAPHASEAKAVPFAEAPPGMLGLETALAVSFSALCGPEDGAAGSEDGCVGGPKAGGRRGPGGAAGRHGHGDDHAGGFNGFTGEDGEGDDDMVGPSVAVPLEVLLDRMSWTPARIAGLTAGQGGPVVAGRPANLCIWDPAATWTVDAARLASRSRNTPFAGTCLHGRVRHTVLAGEPVVVDGLAQR